MLNGMTHYNKNKFHQTNTGLDNTEAKKLHEIEFFILQRYSMLHCFSLIHNNAKAHLLGLLIGSNASKDWLFCG